MKNFSNFPNNRSSKLEVIFFKQFYSKQKVSLQTDQNFYFIKKKLNRKLGTEEFRDDATRELISKLQQENASLNAHMTSLQVFYEL